jgi:AcrR family transcriptional regulator
MTAMTADTATGRAVGRPRSTRASQAIIHATLELLGEGSTIEALSIEAVAARAGVGKATVYRRWPNKEALVIDAIARIKGPVPRLGGRSVREDLVTLVRSAGRSKGTREGRLLLAVLPELHRTPELGKRYTAMVEEHRDVLRGVLRRGMATGELTRDLDVELAVAMLVSPMISVAVMRTYPRISQERLAERIVDLALAGLAGDAVTAERRA